VLGVRLGTRYDPADCWAAWMGHWCGVRRGDMAGMTFGQILGLHEFVKANTSEGG
jgi:hypothetical protein